jgi:hypothetical protein
MPPQAAASQARHLGGRSGLVQKDQPVRLKPHDRLARQGPFLAHRAFLLEKVAEKADITMPELAAELAAATCQKVDPASLSRWLIRIGYRFKNVWPAPSARGFVEISC